MYLSTVFLSAIVLKHPLNRGEEGSISRRYLPDISSPEQLRGESD